MEVVEGYRYIWKPINLVGTKRMCKELQLGIHCRRCDSVMIDRVGRVRTKETIWEYTLDEHVLGHAHDSCAYGVEVQGADPRDPLFGKNPLEWEIEKL